jgi:hypothetical protein
VPATSTIRKSLDLNSEEELRWVFVVLLGGSRVAEIWGRLQLLPRFRAADDVTQRAAPKTHHDGITNPLFACYVILSAIGLY